MSPAFLAALAALTIYASLFVVGRVGVTAGLDSFDQSGVRFAVSTILLLPLILTRSREAFRRLGIGCALGITILGGSPYSIIFLSGFMFAPVSYGAAIVPGLQPVVVMLLSYVSLKERPNTGAVVGSGLSLLGVVVMIIDHQQVSPGRAAIGIAIFVAAAFVWGCYAFAVRLWSVKARDVLALVLPISALLYIPPYLAVGLSWQITPRVLLEATTDSDRAAAKRAFEAMMKMKKIDIATIQAARHGPSRP
jgi:drug/metabolite transporter (DMT)-like permease